MQASPPIVTDYRKPSGMPTFPNLRKDSCPKGKKCVSWIDTVFFVLTKKMLSSASPFSLTPILLHSGWVTKGLFPKCLLHNAGKSAFFQPKACITATTTSIFLYLDPSLYILLVLIYYFWVYTAYPDQQFQRIVIASSSFYKTTNQMRRVFWI